jgi:hypothetical protein
MSPQAAVVIPVTWLPIHKIVQVYVSKKIYKGYSLAIEPYKFKKTYVLLIENKVYHNHNWVLHEYCKWEILRT